MPWFQELTAGSRKPHSPEAGLFLDHRVRAEPHSCSGFPASRGRKFCVVANALLRGARVSVSKRGPADGGVLPALSAVAEADTSCTEVATFGSKRLSQTVTRFLLSNILWAAKHCFGFFSHRRRRTSKPKCCFVEANFQGAASATPRRP